MCTKIVMYRSLWICSNYVYRLLCARAVYTFNSFVDVLICVVAAVFVYDYHAGSETLMSRHFSSVQPASPHKQRPSNPVPGGTCSVIN